MRILFLRPAPSTETIGLKHVMIVEPLELEVLAALLSPDDEPHIIDLILEKQPAEFFIEKLRPQVLCITGYVTNIPAMKELADLAKTLDPNIITIAGGVHLEVCPEDLNHGSVDFRIYRNSTRAFPALIEMLKDNEKVINRLELPHGVLAQGMKADFDLPLDFYFPQPRRDLTKKYRSKYFYIFHQPVALLKTAFGCPFRCSFCFCRKITQGTYMERPLKEVALELKNVDEKNVYIVDDDFLVSRNRVLNFIKMLRKEKIKKRYLVYGRADFIANNEDILKEFHAWGLRTVIVGIESFFPDELKKYQKDTSIDDNQRALAILKKNKIDVYATMIIPPHWSKKEFRLCGDYLIKSGIHYVNLQPFTPLHGTGLSAKADDLIIPYEDYEKWDLAHVTIRPDQLSVAQFYRELLALYRRVLFQPKILLDYFRHYRISQLIKMLCGSMAVARQYKKKIREAIQNA